MVWVGVQVNGLGGDLGQWSGWMFRLMVWFQVNHLGGVQVNGLGGSSDSMVWVGIQVNGLGVGSGQWYECGLRLNCLSEAPCRNIRNFGLK